MLVYGFVRRVAFTSLLFTPVIVFTSFLVLVTVVFIMSF
jgi:hypothetical protein